MNTTKILECERESVNRFSKRILLPNYYKKIGLLAAILLTIGLISISPLFELGETAKTLAKNIILIALLLAVLSKEVIEDELIDNLRGKAFSFAFIAGVTYAIFQPYVNFFVGTLIRPEKASFDGLGDFQILWFMLVIYLCVFHLFKRTS